MKQLLWILLLLAPLTATADSPKSKKKQTWENSVYRRDPQVRIVFGTGATAAEANQDAARQIPTMLGVPADGKVHEVPPYNVLDQYIEYSKKKGYRVILFVKAISKISDEEMMRIDYNSDNFNKELEETFKKNQDKQ